MRNPFRRDLVLLHPPALYDFRSQPAHLGPVADAVPSTPMFEMYPIGLSSIAAYLEQNHYNVKIVNLAYRMLRSPRLDVERLIARLDASVFGIDLHWLPHVQGALAIAELVRRHHPESRILMGGLSASYYHEELVRFPFVDYVVRGDSTEEPVRQLLQALRESRPLDTVENLTWKCGDGTVVTNPLSFVPDNLDYVDVPAYRYLLRSMFKYASVRNLVPSFEWLRYPITLVLNARGCTEDCAVCGGSASAYRRICNRSAPAFRSPEKLAQDIATIASFSCAPIFIVHDPRMGGAARAKRLFGLLERMDICNEIVIELFYPGDEVFFTMVEQSVNRWSAEITLESPDEATRRCNGKFPWPNARVESTIQSALAHGCHTLDVFFMIGLPHQTYRDALAIGDYCEHLMRRFGSSGRLRPFVAPLGPFLDPGSRAFEEPAFGYRALCRSLQDHRELFPHHDWPRILSYETDTMTREEIARATAAVSVRLNSTRQAYGLTTMFGEHELSWPVRRRFRVGMTLLRSLAAGLVEEVGHTAARLTGRYDTAALRP